MTVVLEKIIKFCNIILIQMKNKNNLKEKDKQMVKQPMLFNDFLNQIEDVKAQLKNEGFDMSYENLDEAACRFEESFPGFMEVRGGGWGWDPYWEISNAELLAEWLYTFIYMAHDEDFDYCDADADERFHEVVSALAMFGDKA